MKKLLTLFFLILVACDNSNRSEQKMLERCADDNVQYTNEFEYTKAFLFPADDKKKLEIFEKKELQREKDLALKLKLLLNLALKEKMNNSSYFITFSHCVNLKKNSPEIFKAKYE